MRQHKRLVAALVAATALAGGQLTWTGATAGAAAGAETTNPGIERLRADVTDGLTIDRGADGNADFIGTTAGNRVVNPAVSGTTSVRDAARAHLARYGAALGLADADLVATGSTRSASGQDVVRFQQEVDSAPVIGGQVTVSLRSDRQLGSMLASTSDARTLARRDRGPSPPPRPRLRVPRLVPPTPPASTTTSEGRAVWDPSVFGATGDSPRASGSSRWVTAPPYAAWSSSTTPRAGCVLNLDQVEHLDRVVCDRNNVRGAASPVHLRLRPHRGSAGHRRRRRRTRPTTTPERSRRPTSRSPAST